MWAFSLSQSLTAQSYSSWGEMPVGRNNKWMNHCVIALGYYGPSELTSGGSSASRSQWTEVNGNQGKQD